VRPGALLLLRRPAPHAPRPEAAAAPQVAALAAVPEGLAIQVVPGEFPAAQLLQVGGLGWRVRQGPARGVLLAAWCWQRSTGCLGPLLEGRAAGAPATHVCSTSTSWPRLPSLLAMCLMPAPLHPPPPPTHTHTHTPQLMEQALEAAHASERTALSGALEPLLQLARAHSGGREEFARWGLAPAAGAAGLGPGTALQLCAGLPDRPRPPPPRPAL
jgi:hypothetical protein